MQNLSKLQDRLMLSREECKKYDLVGQLQHVKALKVGLRKAG